MLLTQSHHCVFEALFSSQCDEPCPELAEDGVVKAWVKYFETVAAYFQSRRLRIASAA